MRLFGTTALVAVALAASQCAAQPQPNPSCSVCGNGMKVVNPDAVVSFIIPGNPFTITIECGVLENVGSAGTLGIDPDTCAVLPQLISTVCGCEYAQPCSCSPTKFTFQLKFDGTCEPRSLTGVLDSLCLFEVDDDPPTGPESEETVEEMLSTISAIKEQRRKHSHDFGRRLFHQDDTTTKEQSQRALNSQVPTSITKVVISEYDGSPVSPESNVINQIEITDSDQDLSNGDTFSYTSISSQLEPDKPLEGQTQYFVPVGLSVMFRGINTDNQFVTNIFAWEYYAYDCTTEPIAIGDMIGWTIVSATRPAAGAFCPTAVTMTPSLAPSSEPSSQPSSSLVPSVSKAPSEEPSNVPSDVPSLAPSSQLSSQPSNASSKSAKAKAGKFPKSPKANANAMTMTNFQSQEMKSPGSSFVCMSPLVGIMLSSLSLIVVFAAM